MFKRICLVHYHEIGLKGHNRSSFEHRLLQNIKAALSFYPSANIQRISGRMLVEIDDETQLKKVAGTIKNIPGVVRVSQGWKTRRDVDDFCKAAELALFDCGNFETFKVKARRSNTDFPIDSMQLNQIVGAHLCEFAPDKKVLMKNPDVTVHVEVIQGFCVVFSRSEKAIGGLPVGSAGKVISLLSSGIDSPVASWKMMKRGAVVIGLHFSGRPQTAQTSEYLVDDIAHVLEKVGGMARVYIVPLGNYQREIALSCPQDLRIILYRRLMFRVAQAVAGLEGAKALVTGESLGQVASQTLDNIAATNAVVSIPVLRPLIGTDKQEIIDKAKEIGTLEISEQSAQDCCTLFMPKSPQTHAKIKDCEQAEKAYPIDEWVSEIISAIEYKDYICPAYSAPKKFRNEKRQ